MPRGRSALVFTLRGRYLGTLGDAPLSEVPLAIACIEAERGRITVRELASAMATTERTLRRAFVRAVGVSPKTYAAIVRVNQVIAELHRAPPESWHDIVDHFGYADQSHFGREFRRFTGVSPTTYLPDESPLERSFFESA